MASGQAPASARKSCRSDVTAAAAAASVTAPGVDVDLDLDLSSDIKGILAALQHVRKKAKTDGQKRNDEIITSVRTEIASLLDDAKLKSDKERQTIAKAAAKVWKDCEGSLKTEAAKYQAAYEKFCKDRELYQRAYEDAFSKFEELKDSLFTRYDQQRKKEKAILTDLQKTCAEKISAAEEQVKKKRQDEKSFSMLRKTLDSFLQDDED